MASLLTSRARTLLGSPHAVCIIPEVITPAQEKTLVRELEPVLKRRRYERDHWDQVIVGFKEVERPFWSDPENEATVANIRRRIQALVRDNATAMPAEEADLPWLPPHVIDLAADGFITPHVDSIKFSGGLVCGLSLLSPAVMTLTPESDLDTDDDGGPGPAGGAALPPGEGKEESSVARLFLPPRSLYVLSGNARYHFAHSIEGDLSGVDDAAGIEQEAKEVFGAEQFARERRISVIFRDAKRELQEG